MPASHGHNEACCNIPPVISKGYQAKGTYEEIGGYKTYVTGPADATKAIVLIYDIFGYFEQTLQGADILAFSDKQKYKVYMPDWFKGNACAIDIYPPDNDDKKKRLGEFLGTYNPPKIAGEIPGYVKAIKDTNSSITKFGILGLCWGGKVAALAVKADTNPFAVAASAHPAMVDAADAKGVNTPFTMLASMEESPEDVKAFEDALGGPKHVEIFADQIHGWMGARANLSDSRVKDEYQRGYKTVLSFFGQHMVSAGRL